METRRYPRVILFSSGSCPWCSRAKNYLRQKGIRVKEVRVDKNPDAAKDVVRMTGQMGVPVLLIGTAKIVGFDKARMDRLLGLKGSQKVGKYRIMTIPTLLFFNGHRLIDRVVGVVSKKILVEKMN